MTQFVGLKLEKCSLGRAGDFTSSLGSKSSPQRMDQTHLRSVFYPQLMVWKGGGKAVTLYHLSGMK